MATRSEELVRDLWAAWNDGVREFDPELTDPEVEIHSHMTQSVFTGRDGIRRWMAEIDQQFEQWSIEIDELRTLTDGRVFVLGSIRGVGKQSGVVLDEPAAWFVEFRDGRALRLHNHIGRDAVDRAHSRA